jgi:hypothetical protein
MLALDPDMHDVVPRAEGIAEVFSLTVVLMDCRVKLGIDGGEACRPSHCPFRLPMCQVAALLRIIPKSGYRFSEMIMRQRKCAGPLHGS